MCEQLKKKKTLKSITFPDFLVNESRLINREGLVFTIHGKIKKMSRLPPVPKAALTHKKDYGWFGYCLSGMVFDSLFLSSFLFNVINLRIKEITLAYIISLSVKTSNKNNQTQNVIDVTAALTNTLITKQNNNSTLHYLRINIQHFKMWKIMVCNKMCCAHSHLLIAYICGHRRYAYYFIVFYYL